MGSSAPMPVGLLAASGLGHPAVLSTPSLEDFQHSFFSPAFSPEAPQVPLCLDPSPLLCSSCCLAGKSAPSFTAAPLEEARLWLAGVPSWEQGSGLAGYQCDHPLWGAEPHPSSTHILLPQNPSHNTWDQVTSVAQQAQIVPERVLCSRQGTAPPDMCLLPGPALADATACKRHTGTVSMPAVIPTPLLQPQGQAGGQSQEAGHTAYSQAGMPTATVLGDWSTSHLSVQSSASSRNSPQTHLRTAAKQRVWFSVTASEQGR